MTNFFTSHRKAGHHKTGAFVALAALWLALGCGVAQAGYEKAALRFDIGAPETMALRYDVYAGGFKALDAALELRLDPKAYDVSLTAETQGFIGKVFPWKADMSTSGKTEKGQLVPKLYTSTSLWRADPRISELTFDPSGKILKHTRQKNGVTSVDRNMKKALTENTFDLLTGALLAFQEAGVEDCDASVPVFDGKRRYNITLKDGKTDTIRKSKYTSFAGEALRCTLRVEPVAGFSKRDSTRGWMVVQNHTEERKKPPTVWLARLEENGPVVPVRMEISSEYGAVVAHLKAK